MNNKKIHYYNFLFENELQINILYCGKIAERQATP